MDSRSLPRSLSAGPFTLRLPEPRDEADVVAACQDPEIPKWTTVPSPYRSEEFQGFLEFTSSSWGSRAGMEFVIENAEGRVVGAAGARTRWETDTAEVGYWVAAHARGQGVGKTAMTAVCDWLVAQGFRRLCAEVLDGNDASGALLSSLGFQHEGTLRSVAAGRCGDGIERLDMQIWGRVI